MLVTRTHLIALALATVLPLAVSAQEVRDREANQQTRIGQGLQSGQITGNEATHLERRETAINASRRADLAAHGGRLTAGEYHALNRRENAVSSQIYIDKHNAATQPGVLPR